MSKKYNRETIACYYSFEDCHILIGGLDKNTLVVHTEQNLKNVPVHEIAWFLKSFELPVWINTHEPLKAALGFFCQGELNFDHENEIERANLDDLFKSLMQSDRLVKTCDVTLQASTSTKCIKILLKALLQELALDIEQNNFFIDFEKPSELHQVLNQYELFF